MEKEDKDKLREAHESIAKSFGYIYDKEKDILGAGISLGKNPEDKLLIPAQGMKIPPEDLECEQAEELDKIRIELGKCFEDIIQTLKYYVDLKEENYPLIALWILGANMIEGFNTYPYLYLNAPKGSGKTRLMNIITKLAGGIIVNSLTEAVLFRTKGCLGIDEFEKISDKGKEGLRELLNSAYKKGTKVLRMKKQKTPFGDEQVVEEFEVYRPLVMANISGMEEVLGDRCFHIILDKSNNPVFTKKVEIFNFDEKVAKVCSWCSVVVSKNVYKGIETAWNDYLDEKYNYITYTTTQTTLTSFHHLTDKQISFFNRIDDSNINGRSLELSFPLLFLADFLDGDLFDRVLLHLKRLDEEKNQEDLIESWDISFIDFVSGQIDDGRYIRVSELTSMFRTFLNTNDEALNSKWVGQALVRLNLALDKKRKSSGVMVKLNIKKAEEKIKVYRPNILPEIKPASPNKI